MWLVVECLFYLLLSYWIMVHLLAPPSAFPPSPEPEIVGSLVLMHVILVVPTFLLWILSFLFGIGPLKFLSCFLFALAVYLACNHVENKKIRARYRLIPGVHGPKEGAHWFWGDMMNMKKNLRKFSNDYNVEQHDRFGPVVAICPPWFGKIGQVKVTDPADVQYILKDNFDNFIKPPFFRELFGEILGDGIFISQHAHTPDGGKNWKLQRKIASNIFTSRNFRENFCHIFTTKATQVRTMLGKAGSNIIDWQKVCSAFTLDSIGEIGFGMSLQCLDNLAGGRQPLAFATAFDRAQALCLGRLSRPGLVRKWGRLMKPERELRGCVRTMDEFTSKVIADRRQHPLEDKTDLLSLFMAYRPDAEDTSDSPTSLSDKFLKDVVMSFFIAELLQEIDSVCPDGSLPTYEMVKGSTVLPYLDGVIKEALRLFPPVPVDPKYAVEPCELPSGYKIPPRCIVFYEPYVMGRMQEMYPDPLKMDPLRWANQPEPSPYSFPVFQAGKRICLGMAMAMMEVKILTIMVLQAFTLQAQAPNSMEDIKFSLALTLSLEDGLPVKVFPRAA